MEARAEIKSAATRVTYVLLIFNARGNSRADVFEYFIVAHAELTLRVEGVVAPAPARHNTREHTLRCSAARFRRLSMWYLSRRNAFASPVMGLTRVVQSRSIMMEHFDCCTISREENGRTRDASSSRRGAGMREDDR